MATGAPAHDIELFTVQHQVARGLIGVSAVGAVLVAIAFLSGSSLLDDSLPFATTHITNLFLGSVALAYAAPALWMTWTNDLAAFAGAGLTIIAVSAGLGVGPFLNTSSEPQRLIPAIGALIAIVVTAPLTWWSARLPFRDPRPAPTYVRGSFIVFSAILLLAGISILVAVPDVLPWRLGADGQAFVGWIFLSDGLYFAYGVVRPAWANGAGQLLAFLVYDVALIVPLVLHFSDVVPGQRLSLTAYVGVLAFSGAIAAYAFLVDRRTRIGSIGAR